jgi:GT2 family glycosyltransferase
MGTTPRISVVIPTYNRVDRWPAVLRGLMSQTLDAGEFEVVVVSDGSTDGTDEFLTDANTPFALVHERQENAGPAAARNRGVELARARVILFLDDDIVALPSLAERHLSHHVQCREDLAVIGPMLSPPDATLSPPIRWEQAMLYKQYDAMRRGEYEPGYRQFFTGNASVPRACVQAVGGFDLRFRRNEDVELAYRMALEGIRFVFDADAAAHHYADRPFRSWLRNAHEYGVNDVIFARDYPESWLFEWTRQEFEGRHRLVRWATRTCIDRPWLEAPFETVLRGVAAASERLHAQRLAESALSGLYNVAYYCGMAEELGGSSAPAPWARQAVADGTSRSVLGL